MMTTLRSNVAAWRPMKRAEQSGTVAYIAQLANGVHPPHTDLTGKNIEYIFSHGYSREGS